MKKRILVVEKDIDIRNMISFVLEDANYDCLLYSDEENIFEHILETKPDVILLDIVKPTEDGTKLCREIKAATPTQHIPVIVLSTHSKIEVVREICADEVIPKPFDIDLLLETIAEQLNV